MDIDEFKRELEKHVVESGVKVDSEKELEQKVEVAKEALRLGKIEVEREKLDLEWKHKLKLRCLEIDVLRGERDLKLRKETQQIVDEAVRKMGVEITEFIKRMYGG